MINKFTHLYLSPDGDPGDPPGDPPVMQTPPSMEAAKQGPVTHDWERAYKGLQGKFQSLTESSQVLNTQLNEKEAEIARLSAEVVNLKSQVASLSDGVSSVTREKEVLVNSVQTHESALARAKLIMAKYPDLVQYEGNGLLPSAETEEALVERLELFKKTLTATIQGALDEKHQGLGPPPLASGEPVKRTKETVYNEMLQYAGKTSEGDRAKYNALEREWAELNKK